MRKLRPFLILLIAYCSLDIDSAHAQDFWQQTNGPYGGSVYGLVIKDPGLILAGDYNRGIFRSTDNGSTWKQVADTLTYSLYPSFGISPTGDVFLGAGKGIFKSTDNGMSWVNIGLTETQVSTIAINSQGLIFVGTWLSGNYRSTDNGKTWTRIATTLGSFRSIVLNSSDHIFVASDAGVYRSTDNGVTWTNINTGLSTFVSLLVISPFGNLFAGSLSGADVFRSTNNGDNWQKVNNGLPNAHVEAMVVNRIGEIFVGIRQNGVYLSTNNGDLWTQTNLTTHSVFALAADSTGKIFAGTYAGGIFKSSDNGRNWFNVGYKPTFAEALLADRDDIFAAAGDAGVVVSKDNGNNWINTGLSTSSMSIRVISLAMNSSGDLFAGTWFGMGIFRSTDRGKSWSEINSGLADNWILTVAVNSLGQVFAGTWRGGIFRSSDNGDTWFQLTNGLGVDEELYSLVTTKSGVILIGTYRGVYRSSDNGNSWQHINDIPNNITYSLIMKSTGEVFAGTSDYGVFLSTDEGTSWRPTGSLTGTVKALAVRGASLFAGTNNGVFVSTNNGVSWTAVNSGLTNTYILSLAVTSAGYLYAGTSGNGGVFRSVQPTADPTAPTLFSPANGSSSQPTTLTLSWSASPGASTYRLQVSTSSAFTTTVFDDSTITGTSKSVGPLAYNTTYYWRAAARGAGGSSSFSSAYSFSTLSEKTVTSQGISFPSNPTSSNDYRLVSFPGSQTLQVSLVLAGSQNQDWRIFTDNGGSPPNHLSELNSGSTLEVGKGYWLVQKGTFVFSRSVTMPPLSEDGTSSISLRSGWIIIGLPFDEAVSINAVIAANGLPSNTKFWTYAGSQGFQSVSQIEPFKGYYFNNTQGRGALKIPYPFPSMKIAAPPAPPIEWKLQIVVESQTNQDAENFVGIAPSSSNALDALDEQKPPFFADQTVLYFSRPEWDKRYRWFSTDFRPAVGEGQAWDFEVSNPRFSHGTIRIVGIENVPAEYEVILLNASNTVPVSLRESAEYRYQTVSEKMSFRLVVGKKGFLSDGVKKTVPSEFALEQNYPNPFNPSTSISFKLPREAQIRLQVISLLGQSVALLAEGRYPPGTHTVVWNSSDHNNGRSSSGVYLYRLVVDGSVLQTKKMILLQ